MKVDTVAGATSTSNAVKTALSDAIRQSGIAEEVTALRAPGTYT